MFILLYVQLHRIRLTLIGQQTDPRSGVCVLQHKDSQQIYDQCVLPCTRSQMLRRGNRRVSLRVCARVCVTVSSPQQEVSMRCVCYVHTYTRMVVTAKYVSYIAVSLLAYN